MAQILVIEDNEAISSLLCMNLLAVGHTAKAVPDGGDALVIIQSGEHFDLALVDVMLPHLDGFDLLQPLMGRNIPVIYLTAKNDTESKIRGLRGGAEDYIVKPFDILELLVRIGKVLERHGAVATEITLGHVVIHVQERVVRIHDEPCYLKPREFDLLVLLAKNKNIALPRQRILIEVWGANYLGETRTVDVHITQLRKKTGLTIASVPRIGYRLEQSP